MILGIVILAPDRYLDPGSGSYIFQLLIAFLVGAAFLLKVYWQKVRVFLQKMFSRGKHEDEN